MKLIKAQFTTHIRCDQQSQCNSTSESDEIDEGIGFVFKNVSSSGFKEVLQHVFGVGVMLRRAGPATFQDSYSVPFKVAYANLFFLLWELDERVITDSKIKITFFFHHISDEYPERG
jgi:hypothetical protein